MDKTTIEEKFDKDIIDYFWDKENVIGTQRLSINHIEKIKQFLFQTIEDVIKELVGEELDCCVCKFIKGDVKCCICGINKEKNQ